MIKELEEAKNGLSGIFTTLLSPANSTVIFINHKPQEIKADFADQKTLINNMVELAKAARSFNVPAIMTTFADEISGEGIFPQIRQILSGNCMLERDLINAWDDESFVEKVKQAGRNKLIISGLWTETCVCGPALSALEAGYDVYICVDACAGTSRHVHDKAIERMIQAGCVPVTRREVMLEWQIS